MPRETHSDVDYGVDGLRRCLLGRASRRRRRIRRLHGRRHRPSGRGSLFSLVRGERLRVVEVGVDEGGVLQGGEEGALAFLVAQAGIEEEKKRDCYLDL